MSLERLPRGYDEWRTRNREDQEYDRNNEQRIADAKADRADAACDRKKDERAERRRDDE